MNSKQYSILIVDDEADILEFIEYNLVKSGYTVTKAENGKEAITKARNSIPDLILLDVMMPEMNGIEVCKQLRENRKFDNTIIAFLSAKHEDIAQISGLDAGADDYISKPIKPRVLLSRISALLRRLPDNRDDIIEFDDVQINKEEYKVSKGGIKIKLPRKEFELLLLLCSKPGKVFTREEIYKSIWGPDLIVGMRTIDVHIRKLREKLGDNYIHTIKGIGYKFEA